jgi:flagellar assembly protein FliH
MSDMFAGAERVAVWTKRPSTPPPFTAWGDALRHGFEVPEEPMVFEAPPAVDIDVIRAEAMAQGYAAGIAAGREEAEAERVAIKTLASSLEVLRPEPTQALGALIAATVERLVGEVVGEVEIDRDTLMLRAQAAAALIGDETRPAVLKLNPDDVAYLDGAALPVAIEADASISPGNLRLETVSGWIEDGLAVRLERLRCALDRIAAAR